jgi:hypothetical protein
MRVRTYFIGMGSKCVDITTVMGVALISMFKVISVWVSAVA